jgi:hypothetical protein
MATAGSAYVDILPSIKGIGSKLDKGLGPELDSAGKRGGKRFGDVFARSYAGPLKAIGAAAVGVFATAKVAGFLRDSIAEARESQKVGALTAQVIKSTGGAAKVTAAQVGDLATAISNQTGIDDEAVQSASNLLLTFKNLRNEVGKGNDVFNQATQIATDMGAALGTEPKAAAIQLGKALNDPTKGIAALSRVGVTFNKQQTDQIKKMQASGNILGAQKIILGELKSEFGGAAAASATAGEKFATTYANFKESIGTALLPILDKVLGVATRFVTYLMGNMGPAFAAVGKFVKPAVDTVKLFIGTITGKGADVGDLPWMNAVIDAGAAVSQFIAGLLPSLQRFGQVTMAAFRRIIPVLLQLGQAVMANVLPTLSRLGAFFTGTILPAVSTVVSYIVANVVPIFVRVGQIIATQVLPIIGQLAGFLVGTLLPVFVAVYTKVAGSLKPVFDQLVATFQARVLPAVQSILAKFREWLPTIEAVVVVVAKVLGKVLELAAAILGKVLPVVIRFAGFLLGTLIGAVVAVIGVVVKIVAKMIAFGGAVASGITAVGRFAGAVRAKIGDALTFIAGLPGKVKGALSGAGKWLVSAGKNIVQGLIDGIGSMAKDVVSALLDLLPGPLKKFAGKLGIHSPSTVFEAFGENTVKGFVLGVKGSQGSVDSVMGDMSSRVALPALSVPRVPALRAGSLDSASAADRASAVMLVSLPKDQLDYLADRMASRVGGAITQTGSTVQTGSRNRPHS